MTARDASVAYRTWSPMPAPIRRARNALQGAFTCSKDMPEEFDKLLARLR